MSALIIEAVAILLLLVVSGVFAMTELAVVSSRKTRLRVMAAEGNAVAKLAPLLGEFPLAATLAQRGETLAAYATAQLGQSISEGAIFVREGVRFEIIDMDGRRIDKVLVSREGKSP